MKKIIVALTVTLLCLMVPLAAQYTGTSLSGTVTDSSGAGVPEAKISASNADTGQRETTLTNSRGSFLFAPPGRSL